MADDAQTRKLATIVALDVAGFSARTEADEARTIAQVANLRPVIEGIAKTHGGRVFNTAGDGFMLEFASSLSGVSAALELADECRPRVRVGVHVGEVAVQPNGDLLGHGVNVAARLMAKAEPGSAIISADVCRMIRGPLAERFVSRGPVQLDKMNETIEVFAPAAPSPAPAPVKPVSHVARAWPKPTPRLVAMIGVPMLLVILAAILWSRSGAPTSSATDAPTASIAVLPFENLSTDKDNAFFAVGIQDEILTRLAKIGALKVISRTSTARLASRPENLPEIARELGVANVLEGSVQRSGDKVRVNVQLIRASTDEHLWAEIYDRKMEDIFTVQSEISTAIAAALSAKVSGGEQQVLAEIPTTNTAAYDAFLRGVAFKHEESSRKAADAFREAVRLDPKFAQAWVQLAMMTANDAFVFKMPELAAEARNALETAKRLQPDLPELPLAEGFFLYYIKEDFEGARQQFERAHAERPNDVESIYELGLIARRQGRWDDAKSWLEQAITLDPMRADVRLSLQQVLSAMRDFAGATRVINDAMNRWPDNTQVILGKLDVLIYQGQVDEAAALMKPLKPQVEDGMAADIHDTAVMRRKYDDAIPMLQSLVDQKPEGIMAGFIHSSLGHLYALSGDAGKAKDSYDRAKAVLLATLAKTPDNRYAMVNLAFTYAYAGERDLALKYVEMAIRQVPSSRDFYAGPIYEDARARIWAMFGERDRAIPELARLLKTTYASSITPAILRLDPTFDKLRGDPRFEALLN